MNKLRALSEATIKAKSYGHYGIYTVQDLGFLLKVPVNANFHKLLYKATQQEVLRKVCTNIYINPLTPPEGRGVLAKIARLLHWNHFLYVSMESQLSHLGVISQVMMNYLTVMTTGRRRTVSTLYGTIEFTHTSRSVASLIGGVYYDPDTGIFRATEEVAIRDLRRVGRNVHMLEG